MTTVSQKLHQWVTGLLLGRLYENELMFTCQTDQNEKDCWLGQDTYMLCMEGSLHEIGKLLLEKATWQQKKFKNAYFSATVSLEKYLGEIFIHVHKKEGQEHSLS